jgi:catechol 2,3-dioxygenase-like lactoylglutathione lyase family enzyme
MAKIRHIAITTRDPDTTAAWYVAAFGLQEAGRSPSGAVYLTDGDLNLTVLPERQPGDTQRTGVGLDHFGFMDEDPEALYRRLDAMGVARLPDQPIGSMRFEAKFVGPDGVILDVGEQGWVGARPVEAAAPASVE